MGDQRDGGLWRCWEPPLDALFARLLRWHRHSKGCCHGSPCLRAITYHNRSDVQDIPRARKQFHSKVFLFTTMITHCSIITILDIDFHDGSFVDRSVTTPSLLVCRKSAKISLLRFPDGSFVEYDASIVLRSPEYGVYTGLWRTSTGVLSTHPTLPYWIADNFETI